MAAVMAGTGAEAEHEAAATERAGTGDVLFWSVSALLAAWALFQNFFKIGTAPILADEPTYVTSGWRYLHGQAGGPPAYHGSDVAVPGNYEHPPLAKYLFGLAQMVTGTPRDLTAARCVSATATILAALVVGIWLARAAGRWPALSAAGLIALLPQPAGGSDGRFDRFAMLDPTATLFMVLSVVLAWEWFRRGGRDAWRFALLTGGAVALAAGAKENGWLGAVGPVALVVGAAVRTRQWPLIRARLGQAAAAVAVAAAGFAVLYLPIGDPVGAVRYLIDFQTAHSDAGHMVGFAGRVTARPPWWANLWFAGHGYGSALTCVVLGAAACAVAVRRDLVTGWCLAAVAAPFVFHCFVAHVALGYYWVMWTPMFLALAALGGCELVGGVARAASADRGSRVMGLRGPLVAGSALAVLAVPVVDSVAESVATARIHPVGPQVLPGLMARRGLSGPIVSTGVGRWAYEYYLPSVTVLSAAEAVTRPDTIVIAKPQCRDPLDPSVRALVAVNEASGSVRRIHEDSAMTVYAVVAPLTPPTAGQIAAEPPSRPADRC